MAKRVSTWASKQIVFDRDQIQGSLISGESEYVILCMRPDSVAYLLQLATFYQDWRNRWPNWTDSQRVDLVARTVESLVLPLACSEDIQAIINQLTIIATTQAEIRDRLGPVDSAVTVSLDAIEDKLEEIRLALPDDFPTDIFDQVEEVLNGVGVILGAPGIAILP